MAKLNLIDRVIAGFDPVRAARRLHARSAIEAFSSPGGDGAASSPLNAGRWATVPRSADADTVRGLPRQRAESRELVRSNPIAAGAITTNLDRVVGTGLVPVFEPARDVLGWSEDQAAEWKARATREFSLWADSKECTLDGQQTFYERQALVLGSRLESGDCGSVLPDGAPTSTQPYKLRLQLVEADRVGNPSGAADTDLVVAGVRLEPGTGRPLAYHVYDRHPGSAASFTRGNRYAGQWIDAVGPSGRRRFLHHFRPTRPEQTRGVPYLAPVIQAIKDLGRFTESEIAAAVLNSFWMVFIETDGAAGPAPVFGMGTPGAQQPGQDPAAGAEIAMAPGAVVGLNKGEKANFADPKRPNLAHEPFVDGILKYVGMGLGIPVELLTKRFNASYSASKAALLDAWMHFRGERVWLALSFCQPVAETWMAEAVSTGRLPAPGFFRNPLVRWAYTRITWHGDSQGSINPKDEVAAYTAAIDARLMTRERAEWELFGSDWSRTFDPKKREQKMLRDANMLPVPKAGAAAPANSSDSTPDSTPAADPQGVPA